MKKGILETLSIILILGVISLVYYQTHILLGIIGGGLIIISVIGFIIIILGKGN